MLIYSEIVSLINATDPEQNFFDGQTQSDIGYIKDGSRAGENLAGATPGYVSWNSIRSLQAITKYAMENNLAGKSGHIALCVWVKRNQVGNLMNFDRFFFVSLFTARLVCQVCSLLTPRWTFSRMASTLWSMPSTTR